MFGFAKKQKVDQKALLMTVDSALDNFDAESTDALLAETGKTRQELLNAVMADDEVESCREDLTTGILAEPWRVWGQDVPEATVNRLYKNIRQLMGDFADLVILTKLNGYGVGEYVFQKEPDGFLSLKSLLSKDGELDLYTPKRDGSVVMNYNGEDVAIDQQVKYLVLTSKAVPARPAGEMMVIRAYPAVTMRKRGWAYAGQFIARYAQPYVVGKQGGFSSTGLSDFVSKVFAFLSGGAIGIGKEDEIDVHQLNGDGEAFERLERLANRRIQKLLLGRVKTSELTSGSRAAQETDDSARQDRVSGYLVLMARAMQHAIDALIEVNKYYGIPISAPKGIWFEYEQQFKPDRERADVDKIYMDTGQVRRTKSYYTDMLGWEEAHFEMVQTEQGLSTVSLSNQTTPARARAKIAELLLAANLSDDALTSDDQTREHDQRIMKPKIDALLSRLDDASGYGDFDALLAELDLSDNNGDLIHDIVMQCADSYVDGVSGKTRDADQSAEGDTDAA